MTRRDEQLYNKLRMHRHEVGRKVGVDTQLIVDILEYAFETHDKRNEIPSRNDLAIIIEQAYDFDRAIARREGRSVSTLPQKGTELDPNCQYVGLTASLEMYLHCKLVEDVSESLKAPNDTDEFVKEVRTIASDLYSTMKKETNSPKEMPGEFFDSMADLAAKTDKELIQEALVPYKDKDEGKEAFHKLKKIVDEVLIYHQP